MGGINQNLNIGVLLLHRLSAKKHVRADAKKRARNRHRKVTLRTAIKNTDLALQSGDIEKSQELTKQTFGLLDRAASKGVIKKGTANRQKSRLAQKLNSLTA